MASELKVDKFTGVTTAGSIDVTTGSVTTKLQDGMAVVGCNHDLTNNVIKQSFNIASVTDHGTGNQSFNYTSVLTNNTAMYGATDGYYGIGDCFGSSTSSHFQRIRGASVYTGLVDTSLSATTVHGDLA